MRAINNTAVQRRIELTTGDIGRSRTGFGQEALQRAGGADLQPAKVINIVDRALDHHFSRVDLVCYPIDLMLCRLFSQHVLETHHLVEVGGFPDVTKCKGQTGGDTGKADSVLGIGRGNGTHIDNATAHRVECFLGAEQGSGFKQLKFQPPL